MASKNKKDINKIIKDNKIIIIVGFFHLRMKHLEKKVDKGYIIEIEPENYGDNIIYEQLILFIKILMK